MATPSRSSINFDLWLQQNQRSRGVKMDEERSGGQAAVPFGPPPACPERFAEELESDLWRRREIEGGHGASIVCACL